MSKFYTFVGQNMKDDGQVLHVYYEDGVRHEDTIKYKPLLGMQVKPKEGKTYQYQDIHGNPLKWKRFDNIAKYRGFIDEYDEIDFYGTIKESYQFLGEEYPGEIDYDLSLIRPFLIDIEVDTSVGGPFGSDYVDSAEGPITSIAMKCMRTGRYFLMATKPWSAAKSVYKDSEFNIDLKKVRFKHCETEEALFKYLRKVIRSEKPDMLIGFYSKMFDFPYIVKRGQYVMGKPFMNGFSPWGMTTCKKKVDKETGKIIDFFTQIQGLPLMDFQLMYKKFTYEPRESYSLDFLATAELGETKLDYSQYDNLNDMWEKDPQRYIDYNIMDVELMDLMDQKLDLVNLSCTIAYYAKTNFEDTLGTVGVWDSIFYNTLLKKNVMIPPKHTKEKERYAGAYVFEPKPGIHEWLIAVDLKSLYPHVQQQYNISPESLIDDNRMDLGIDITSDLDERFLNQDIEAAPDTIMAMNGCTFSRDKEGIVPGLLRGIYDNRVKAKTEMIEWKKKLQGWKENNGIDVDDKFEKYHGDDKSVWEDFNKKISSLNNYQMAMKILMNSEYGALANVHFRYYDIRLASAITLCAQMALKWAAKNLLAHPDSKKYKLKLIYGDTDSLYISVKYVADQIKLRKPGITDQALTKQINGFVNKIIQPILTEGYENLKDYVNANENRMFMNHEKTIPNALWTSKKKYALNVLWDEGVTYSEPKLKVKGIEVVRSSTPKVLRDALKESIAIMLRDESQLIEYVKEQKKKFFEYDIVDIAFPRGVNNIEKYEVTKSDGSLSYTKGTPIGVRASIVYNNLVSSKDNGWPLINSGEKIKYVFLKKPNNFDENVIGFMRRIPEEAIPYIDWDMQFEKGFMAVINNIYRKMGKEFKTYKETNLTDLF